MYGNDEYYLSDALLWSLVRRFTKESGLNTCDDYMSEARAAAVFAVRKYNKAKNSSIEAFVIECVKNRLIDVSHRVGVELETETMVVEDSYESERELHFSLTMKQLLNVEEYRVYHAHFVEDRSATEIAKKFNVHKRKVLECLRRICHKFALIEVSHLKISSQRRLTNVWLENSLNLQDE